MFTISLIADIDHNAESYLDSVNTTNSLVRITTVTTLTTREPVTEVKNVLKEGLPAQTFNNRLDEFTTTYGISLFFSVHY